MCFNNFPSLTMAISHALTHRVPHKSVFPCILCAYGENFYISPDFFFFLVLWFKRAHYGSLKRRQIASSHYGWFSIKL